MLSWRCYIHTCEEWLDILVAQERILPFPVTFPPTTVVALERRSNSWQPILLGVGTVLPGWSKVDTTEGYANS
jgi:hypothetical protein